MSNIGSCPQVHVMGTIKTWPAMFSNINTRNSRVDESQPVYNIKIQWLIELPWKQLHVYEVNVIWSRIEFWVDRDRSGIPVAFQISGAKQNTQKKIFVGHRDQHSWQYCRSLWSSACSVRRSDEFKKIWTHPHGDHSVISMKGNRSCYNI